MVIEYIFGKKYESIWNIVLKGKMIASCNYDDFTVDFFSYVFYR